MRRRLAVVGACLALAALWALVLGLTATQGFAAAPPDAGGYFQLTAPGTPLTKTDAQCAAEVRRSPWEPRPQNTAANRTVPPQPFTFGTNSDFPASWNGAPRARVTGNFTGTTDEIMQWAACKWGWSDDLIRAQAVQETSWVQAAGGDSTARTGSPPCPPDYYGATATICPQSFGLLQNKYRYQPADSYPWFRTSTAFGLDYSLWKLRGCYEGVKNGGSAARGNVNLCLANWWSGQWSTAVSYDDSVNGYLNTKPWRGWADQSGQTTPPTTQAATTTRATTTTQAPVTTSTNLPNTTTTTVASPSTTVTTTTLSPGQFIARLRDDIDTYCATRTDC
jgi:hypothetical protein